MAKTVSQLHRMGNRLGLQRDWYLILIAALIGLVMGSVAVAFMLPLRWMETWIGDVSQVGQLWIVPIAPVVGAILAGVTLHFLGDKGRAPGVSWVMYAIHRMKSRMELKLALGKWLASTFTIGSGGSAGAEGPIVTIGSVIGSNIARLFKANPQNTATLLGCGAASGIASVFNAPFAGIFFALEVLLRDFSLRTFTPIVIAAVISSAWTRAIIGDEALFGVGPEFFGPSGQFGLSQIPSYLVLGLTCGVAAAAFTRGLAYSESVFLRVKAPTLLRPAIGAAILGILGLLYILLIPAHGRGFPEFYGNGYPVIKELLSPGLYHDAGTATAAGQLKPVTLLWVIVLLATLKAIGTWLTIGSGGSGGLFAPSLVLGAFTGGGFGYALNAMGWSTALSPAHFALVGMAAMIAATAHAPLTAMLLVYEITQSYAIILPLMLAAVISTIVSRLIYPESVYTVKLTQMGVRLGSLGDLTILRRMSVHDVPLARAVTVRDTDSAQRLLELSEVHLVRDFVVVDEHERYVGMVTGADLAAVLVYREAVPLLQVHELQRTDLPTVTLDEPLDLVLDKFSRHDTHSLAVLDGSERKKVKGLLTRSRLMEQYQRALSAD
ncbi:MAG: chloride channel protein [Phycisphaerales bacterium]|nr:chloride channel protein [Phycisphaerales bacterium]